MDERASVEIGQRLSVARRALKLSKREAARRAGIADITWRQFEKGMRQVAPGVLLPVNPTDENLEAAARAVGLDPGPLFELAGRTYTGQRDEVAPTPLDRLTAVEKKLSDLAAKVDLLLSR